MVAQERPWEWRRAFWSRPGEAIPEKSIIVSLTALVFAVGLLLAVLVYGVGVTGLGLDPRGVAYAFVAGFAALGLLGVRMGIRQHRYGGGVMGPRREMKNR